MQVDLTGIHKVKKRLANGTITHYYYAWRGGPRIDGKPGSDDFLASYQQLKAQRKQPLQGTISWLIEEFKKSDDWRNMAQRTRDDHVLMFRKIREEFGHDSLKRAQERGSRSAFKNWRASMARSPKTADKAFSSLSRLFTWAVDEEIMDRNPCRGVPKLYKGNRANKHWSATDLARFRQTASAQIRFALLIALETGQRQGDLLALKWNQYDGTHLTIKQSKTGKVVRVLCSEALRSSLDALDRTSTHILTSEDRKPWSASGFQASWRRTTRRAGITDRTFHDLRGTFVLCALRAGQKLEDVARVTGHSLNDLRTLEKHYMGWDQDSADDVIIALDQNRRTLKV